jgi:hypothetical protein
MLLLPGGIDDRNGSGDRMLLLPGGIDDRNGSVRTA